MQQQDILRNDVPSDVVEFAAFLERTPKAQITPAMRKYAPGAIAAKDAAQSDDMFGATPTTPAVLRQRLTPPRGPGSVAERTPGYGAPRSIALRGDEFGAPQHGMAAMRTRVFEYANHRLIGRAFRNTATGWDIRVGRKAIEHTTHPKMRENWHPSMLALHALPELIRDATHWTTEGTRGSDRARDIPLHHRLRAPFTVGGKPYIAELTLREHPQPGDKTLYHVKAITVEPDDSAEQPNPRSPTSEGQPPGEPSDSHPN